MHIKATIEKDHPCDWTFKGEILALSQEFR